MLYQEIQKKNYELEHLLVHKSKSNLSSKTITNFLDAIHESIQFIHDPNNYKDTLDLFLKWETILFEYFDGVIYKNSIKYSLSYDKRLSNNLINHQLSIIREINRIKTVKNVDKKIQHLLEIDPISSEGVRNIRKTNKHQKLIIEANLLYKESKISESVSCLYEVINSLKGRQTQNTITTFYIAWALHALGNNFCVCEMYSEAQYYYQLSLELKEKIINISDNIPRGLLLLSYFSTKSKYIYLSQFLDPNYKIDNTITKLKTLKDEVVSKRIDMKSINEKFYTTIVNNINYYIAKNYIYSSKSFNSEAMQQGVSLFKESIPMFQKTNDIAGELKTRIHIATYTPDLTIPARVNYVSDTLKNLGNFSRNDPKIRSLAGKSHLAEHAVEISLEYSAGLSAVFSQYEIFPHGTCDIAASCS